MPQDIFNFEDLSRELAGQYSRGMLTTDEYLSVLETITIAHVSGNNQNTVAV